MLEYLEKLVNIYPATNNQESVKRLIDYVSAHLNERGYVVEILTHNGIHSLYASPSGKKSSKVLLQAHIDVVPGDQRFKLVGDKCFGRGSFDMLFGTACYMQLVDELYREHKMVNIAFMLTGDEEIGGENGVKQLLDDGYTSDVCILPDAGDGWGSLNIAAKGVYQPTIRINGSAHHGARPWEGDGAAIKLAKFLVETEAIFDASAMHNSTMTVARLEAGKASNQGPALAETSLDIRYKDQIDLARIKKEMGLILDKYRGEVIAESVGFDYQLNQENVMVKQFIELYEKHAEAPIRFTKAHGSSDARFFSEHNIPVIMLRPDGGGAHGDNEWISVSLTHKFYALLKEYILTAATKE